MQKLKDRLILGTVAGLGANLIKEAMAETSVRSGLSKYTCRRMIPLVVLSKKHAKSWKGAVIGTSTDMAIAALTGIIITYTLSYTGKDYAKLKGALISSGLLDQVFNAFTRVLPQVKQDPNSNLLCKAIHQVFGITAAAIITGLGDSSLFGDNSSIPGPEALPKTE